MDLHLKNKWFTERTTIGELAVDGVLECLVLEDKRRAPGVKVFGQTAIPPGRYEVELTESPRFTQLLGKPTILPHVMNVPGFEGIRIHPGNTAEDTEGCLLPGQARGVDRVEHSQAAFKALMPKLEAAIARGERIFLTIEG